MKVLACTGGIGSGKTYICRIFMNMGIPVYFSDDRTKELYDIDNELLQGMISLMGEEITVNGKLMKNIVAQKIFTDPQLLLSVEKLVHPAVVRDFCKWVNEIAKSDIKPPFVIIESAIILEKPDVRKVADKILTVSAPEEIRIERIMKRDNIGREEAYRRLEFQWDDKKRELQSDFVIFTGSDDALLPQIEEVIEKMKKSDK